MSTRKLFTFTALLFAVLFLFAGHAKAEPGAGGYLLPDSDTKQYTAAEIGVLDIQLTNYAKNEIYARHGRKFKSAELMDYFGSQPWYNGTIAPADFKESTLSAIELENARILAEREKALSWDGSGYELDQPGYNFDAVTAYFSDDYNIMAGLEMYGTSGTTIMDADHFSLMIPAEPQWAYMQLDRYSFEIYHKPARDDGFGGFVVAIRAFDQGSTDYEELPSYSICGTSADKVFVAIFPTDVQFNWEDSAQAEEYQKLLDWAEGLDEQNNPTANPFDVKDAAQSETGQSTYAD